MAAGQSPSSEMMSELNTACELEQKRLAAINVEYEMLMKMHRICDDHIRLVAQRVRRRGQTDEERRGIRTDGATQLTSEYRRMAINYAKRNEYNRSIGIVTELDNRCEAVVAEMKQRYPGKMAEQLVNVLDDEMNDLAELQFELETVLEDAVVVEADEKPKATREHPASKESEKSVHTVDVAVAIIEFEPAEALTECFEIARNDFQIVDEFGRPLNQDIEHTHQIRGNAARLVYDDGKCIIYEKPNKRGSHIAVRSSNSSSDRTVDEEGHIREAAVRGERRFVGKQRRAVSLNETRNPDLHGTRREPINTRSAAELQVDDDDEGGFEVVYPAEHFVIPTRSSHQRNPIRRRFGKSRTRIVRTERDHRPAPPEMPEEPAEPSPAAEEYVDELAGWTACQHEWTRMLVNSVGVPFLDRAEAAVVEEGNRDENRRRKQEALIREGNRSLFAQFLTKRNMDEAEEARVEWAKSEKACDLLLAMLSSENGKTSVESIDL